MASRRNVLILATAGLMGGRERLFLNALPLLKSQGYDFIFCVDRRGPATVAYQKSGFESIEVKERGSQVVKRIERIIQERGVDLIHDNEFCLEAAQAAKKTGIPHLLHLHGKIENILEGYPPRWILRRLSSVGRLCDFAIGCSQYVTHQIPKFMSPSKAACVYGGVPIKKPVPSSSPKNKQIKTIGMIANFYRLKRHEDFIRAAQYVLESGCNARFFIAGHCWVGSPEHQGYANELKKMIRDFGLQEQVKLYQGLKDITPLQRAMDLFVLPSLDEGLPLALLEAMELARPVIVTQSGGFPEVVRHQENGLLVGEKEPRAIARAILRLLKDERLARTLGQNARKTVIQHFSMDRFVSKLAAVYGSLL